MHETSKMIESGNPADDTRMFRRCLGSFGTGVAVITSEAAGVKVGVTVNSVASVSLDPPLVLWSISRNSRSFDIFNNSEGFAINILDKSQIGISQRFSSSEEDKFAGVDYLSGTTGMPLLAGAIAHIECKKEAAFNGGDHVILLGKAVNVTRSSGDPLLFVQGRYVIASSHPDVPTQAEISAQPDGTTPQDGLIPLVFEVHHLLSEKFEEHRQAEGMGPVVARILAVLDRSDRLSAEAVGKRAYTGVREAEDALTELVGRGHVDVTAGGEYGLTNSGKERREAIRARWKEFQRSETEGIGPGEMAIVTKALTKLLGNTAG